MATEVMSPEFLILNRTLVTLKTMAANAEFTRSENEAVRSVKPSTILRWITLEGADQNQQGGFVNLPKPSILVTPMPVKSAIEGGVSCANDEVITIVIQIVDDSAGSRASSGPYRTYVDWMNRIRHTILDDPTLFRADFDPSIADPYYVGPKDRVPADPQKLWRHSQSVAAFSFFVKVRHHRAWGEE
jgi:hypothetical protein